MAKTINGSVQPKKGNLYTVIRLDGKNKWESTGLKDTRKNKRKAEAILLNRIRKYERRTLTIHDEMLFADFLLIWIETMENQVKANTHHTYKLVVENSIAPYFREKGILLLELNAWDIEDYYAYMIERGCKAGTVQRHHSNIHKALQHALKGNIIQSNPADLVALPKMIYYSKAQGSYYTEEELAKVIKLFEGTLLETPVLMAAIYGLRRSEIIGLRWSAIDFDINRMRIEHTVTGSGQNLLASDSTKTAASRRSLYLLPKVKAHLLKVYNQQQEYKKQYGDAYLYSDYICTWPNGQMVLPHYVSRNFKEILKANTIGLPVYRFHDLRHSCASILLRNNRSLYEISGYLGHASIVSTQRYAHLQFTHTQAMAISMEELILDEKNGETPHEEEQAGDTTIAPPSHEK